jgi:hypothetical protein
MKPRSSLKVSSNSGPALDLRRHAGSATNENSVKTAGVKVRVARMRARPVAGGRRGRAELKDTVAANWPGVCWRKAACNVMGFPGG